VDANKRAVTVAAGACAEHLCYKYQDAIDPDRVAMQVETGFDRFMESMFHGNAGKVLVG
jgi:hypothetical protein